MSPERASTGLHHLHRLMCEVNADQDPASVLRLVADGVVHGTGFAIAAISHVRPDGDLEVVAVAGSAEARQAILGRRRPLADLDAEFAKAESWGMLRFVSAESFASLPPFGWVPDVEPVEGPDAWLPEDALFAPLLSATGELLGVMSVDLPEDGRRPGTAQRELLEIYAVQAGIALDNARQRRQLREQVRLADAVRTVHHTASRLLDIGHVMDTSLAPIVAGLRCQAAWLRVFEGQGELPGRGRGAFHPPSETLVPPDDIVAMARRVALACWELRTTGIISRSTPAPAGLGAEDVEVILDFVTRTGSDSVAVVPVGAGTECLGYMVLSRQTDHGAWTRHELEAASEIGRDLGRAVLHARLYQGEQRLVAELAELDASKSELLATISHELKNPLSAVLGYVELLEETAPATQDTEFQAIKRNIDRLTRLVDDLLLLSQLANPRQPLKTTTLDLRQVVAGVVEEMGIHAGRRRVTLALEPGGPVAVEGNGVELERAVENIVGNAIKYSSPGSRIELAVRRDGPLARFECRDHGLGISPADQSSLFSEFFRSTNPEARRRPGTGLGLSIVKRIAERHRGGVEVDSELARGSTFTLVLPAADAGGQETAR